MMVCDNCGKGTRNKDNSMDEKYFCSHKCLVIHKRNKYSMMRFKNE